jgi:hypothetical protein
MRLLPILVLFACSQCSQPAPKPTQLDAGVSDMFSGKIINCALPVVKVERDSALGDIRGCLLKSDAADVNACAVKQAVGNYSTATVACLIRDVGARANSAYLASEPDPSNKVVADASRAWIYSHAIGYISVEGAQ